ncbi:MAG: SRPBCC family protein [Pyrinomonadaceae bacterium]
MPKDLIRETVPASANAVFAIIHDYGRRLEWDTLLSAAWIDGGAERAGLGVVTTCQAVKILGSIKMRTKYISFQPGKVAAVKLVNRPLFFERFAASIRHIEAGENRSHVLYEYNFKARPRFLQPLLHPIMKRMLKWETRKRLSSLRTYIEKGRGV